MKRGGNVIANFPVNLETIGRDKIKGRFYYVDNENLDVDFLVRFAELNHVKDKENQTLVVIDECSVLFNPRDYMLTNRKKWLSFFAQHRKYGYNFLLVAQMDKQVDKQILGCVENEVKHKKANNYKIFWLLPFPLFVATEYWYIQSRRAGSDARLDCEFFLYRRKYGADFYNTFMQFDKRLVVEVDQREELDKYILETEIVVTEQGNTAPGSERPTEGRKTEPGPVST